MKKNIGVITIFIIGISLMVIIMWDILNIGENKCVPDRISAKVLTVYYQPRSYGVGEAFKGRAQLDNGNIVEYDYHLGETVSVGDTLYSYSGCGEINQPF